MLDISQATHMLTSLGVSGSVAAKAAERAAQKLDGADPVTFLKELQSTLEQLSAEAAQAKGRGVTAETAATGAAAASAQTASTKPYQATAALYSEKTATEAAAPQAAATAPFSNLQEFRAWEEGLGDTFAEDYEVPDYVRMVSMSLSGGDQEVVGRYMFFKNHPEFAADYEAIRSGKLSQFPTDGSTLGKEDASPRAS